MRLQTLATGLAGASAVLGAVHVALTPVLHPAWTVDALWFVGSGLAILVAAAANIICGQAIGARRHVPLAVVNLAMSAFFAGAWLVLPEPQVLVGGGLFLCLAGCSIAFCWTAAPAA